MPANEQDQGKQPRHNPHPFPKLTDEQAQEMVKRLSVAIVRNVPPETYKLIFDACK